MDGSQFIARNRATIVAAGIVALLVGVACGFLFARQPSGTRLVALVHDGNGQVHELPLDTPTSLELRTELGRNVVVIEGGSARMSEADCKNGDCLRQAAASHPGQQIICLPHRLWIEIAPQGSAGGEMDVGAVSEAQDVDFVSR